MFMLMISSIIENNFQRTPETRMLRHQGEEWTAGDLNANPG
jgi:hypothetical protein